MAIKALQFLNDILMDYGMEISNIFIEKWVVNHQTRNELEDGTFP